MDPHGTPAVGTLAAPWSPWAGDPVSAGAPTFLGFLAFELAYIVAYDAGMAFHPSVSAPFWFPDSVLLCALLCTPASRWWLLLIGVLPIRLFVAVPEGICPGSWWRVT